MMMIATNSRARKERKESLKGEYGGIWGEEERNADHGGMV